jgi:hypothetical protein
VACPTTTPPTCSPRWFADRPGQSGGVAGGVGEMPAGQRVPDVVGVDGAGDVLAGLGRTVRAVEGVGGAQRLGPGAGVGVGPGGVGVGLVRVLVRSGCWWG